MTFIKSFCSLDYPSDPSLFSVYYRTQFYFYAEPASQKGSDMGRGQRRGVWNGMGCNGYGANGQL